MAYIYSYTELGRHYKTRGAAKALGVSVPTMLGHLHLLWHFCMEFAQDGNLSKIKPLFLVEAMMWDGDHDLLINVLIESGFLDQNEDGLTVHDWEEYGGRLLAKKRENAERQQRFRNGVKASNGAINKSTNTRNKVSSSDITDTSQLHNTPNRENRVEENRIEEEEKLASAPASTSSTNRITKSFQTPCGYVSVTVPPGIDDEMLWATFQLVTGKLFGMGLRQVDESLLASFEALRHVKPTATPQTLQLFQSQWAATGKSRALPGQVVNEWERIVTPKEEAKFNGRSSNARLARAASSLGRT